MKIKNLRWWIIALVFLAAVLNSVDRQTLSALAPTIQADLGMDDRAYANVVNGKPALDGLISTPRVRIAPGPLALHPRMVKIQGSAF